jgi:hypothetical protein
MHRLQKSRQLLLSSFVIPFGVALACGASLYFLLIGNQ